MSKEAGIDPGSAPYLAADPTRGFDRVLFELSMSDAVTNGDLEGALQEICGAASRALDVRSTNVWLFDATHSLLSEKVGFGRERGRPFASLATAINPDYFAALQQHRVIASENVDADARTAAFCASYFHPRGITATLDAPIRLHGRLLGVICHEHVGGTRPWDAEEERFAASLADLVTLTLVADERAKAQRAVRDSEARFRCLLDGVRDIIFELDRAGNVISVNRAIETVLGFAPAAWIGKHFAGLIAPDDLAMALTLFEGAVTRGDAPTFEIRLKHAAGHVVWIEFIPSVERHGDAVHSVFGVGRDVTARRQRDARRRALVEIGQALARCGDGVGGVLHVVEEQLAAALEADAVTVSLPPAEAGDTGTSGEAFERGPGGATISRPLHTPAGGLGVILAQRTAAMPFDGEETELLERAGRELELALAAARHQREAEENAALSAALVRVGHELIRSLDLPVLLERLCHVTAEVLGCDTCYTFLRDESIDGFVRAAAYGDPPQLDEALRTVPILERQVPDLLVALERDDVVLLSERDGLVPTPFWVAYGIRSCLVIGLRHGTHVVGTLSAAFREDAATFGPRQIRIARGIAQLASLAIANARLVSELEAAGRIKSDFVATMSHELRTPLNVILGFTDLLLLEEFGTLTPEQADTLRRVHTSATELHELIQATLDLSRLESGSVALRIEDVDLRTWLDEVRDETAVLRERNPHVEVCFTLSAPPGLVACDALKLKVILKNLIGNALKFTPAGSVSVDVVVDHEAITMTVRDTGIGIAPEVQEVIFEAFRQVDTSPTRPFGGVGLGLYIVRRLVEALHGRIALESAPGLGAEFRVELPLDRPAGQQAPARVGISERAS
ncbi:GAF domain-containing protein [Candidatus Binatia bacterium]|nr:GAF domain-containing protein [Candidatus Binatia bacterium]